MYVLLLSLSVFSTHFTLPTLLGSGKNESLSVDLVEFHVPGT